MLLTFSLVFEEMEYRLCEERHPLWMKLKTNAVRSEYGARRK